jgi:hypothetical protein
LQQRPWPRRVYAAYVRVSFNIESWNCRHTQHKLKFEYPCCNCVQHVLRYLVTKFKYSCSNCFPFISATQVTRSVWWQWMYCLQRSIMKHYTLRNVQWFWLCLWTLITVYSEVYILLRFLITVNSKVCCFAYSNRDCNILYCDLWFFVSCFVIP